MRNFLGWLVVLAIFFAILYGLAIPIIKPRRAWQWAATIWLAAAVTGAIYALIMFQAGAWETF